MDKDLLGRVQSVDRALTLLEVLGEDDSGQRLTDLARRTGLSLTTVHRLLTTLEQRQFVQFSLRDNLWHVGRQAYAVGSAFEALEDRLQMGLTGVPDRDIVEDQVDR